MSDFEAIKAEISAKHQMIISENDPILVLHTINDFLMKQSAAKQSELLAQFKSELEGVLMRWGNTASKQADESLVAAKQTAERVLNVALEASRQSIESVVDQGIDKTSAGVRKEVEEFLDGFSHIIDRANRLAIFNMLAAGVTLFAAGLALVAVVIALRY